MPVAAMPKEKYSRRRLFAAAGEFDSDFSEI